MTVNPSAAKTRPGKPNKKCKPNQSVNREKFQKAKKALYDYWKD